MRQAAAVEGDAAQVGSALSGLGLVVVAGMGRGNAGQTSKADHKAGSEMDHCRRSCERWMRELRDLSEFVEKSSFQTREIHPLI